MIPHNAYVIIIGAMKCGTSSLYNYLIQDERICPCRTKEPEFFTEHRKMPVKVSMYQDLWDFDPLIHRYVIEASTGYAAYPIEANVPVRIAALGISPKFIYLMRDPFDRVESQYNFMYAQNRYKGNLSIYRESFWSQSDYFLQLAQYLKYFPKESFLLLDFAELAANPESVVRKVYDFIGLDGAPKNGNYGVYNRGTQPYRLQRIARKMKLWLGPLAQFIPRGLSRHIKEIVQKAGGKIEKRHLTQEERLYLREKLAVDMDSLQREFGIDVSRWGF
jgi:hypothetical protein